MTVRDFRQPEYLLGGSGPASHAEPPERRFIQSGDAHLPYTDRKLMRPDDAPPDIATIVKIQQMACEGKRRDEIYRELASRGVTIEQICRALDPPDEGTALRRRPQRATVGYAGFKRR